MLCGVTEVRVRAPGNVQRPMEFSKLSFGNATFADATSLRHLGKHMSSCHENLSAAFFEVRQFVVMGIALRKIMK